MKSSENTDLIHAIQMLPVGLHLFRSTLSWRRSLSYRNRSIDLLCKSMDWFVYDRDFRYKRVKVSLPVQKKQLFLKMY